MAELERRIAALGGVAEGPGRYALGRGYLALERPGRGAARARARVEGRLPHARGLLRARPGATASSTRRALPSCRRADDKRPRRAARRSARNLREPALAYLKARRGAPCGGAGYVEGLIALHERRWTEALDKARAARRGCLVFEAHTLEGDIRLMLANERWVEGGPDEALAELDRAGAPISGRRRSRARAPARSMATACAGSWPPRS